MSLKHKIFDQKFDVCMISSRHPLKDHRIFYKETMSLIDKLGYKVLILAINNDKEEIIEEKNCIIYGIKGNQTQILGSVLKLFKVLRKVNCKVFHIHDFEDLILAPYLRFIKKGKVIYDMHEDYIKMINDQGNMNKLLKFLIVKTAFFFELFFTKFCHEFVIVVERHFVKLKKYGIKKKKINLIKNYIKLDDFNHVYSKQKNMKKEFDLVYCGTSNKQKGLFELIDFSFKKKIKLLLILSGKVENIELFKEYVRKQKIENNVKIINNLSYNLVPTEVIKAKIGVAFTYNKPKYEEGISTKVMEYSALGLPLLTTIGNTFRDNFIRKHNSGSFVKNLIFDGINEGYEDIIKNYRIKSKNTLKSAKEYSWNSQEKTLIDLYNKLIKKRTY